MASLSDDQLPKDGKDVATSTTNSTSQGSPPNEDDGNLSGFDLCYRDSDDEIYVETIENDDLATNSASEEEVVMDDQGPSAPFAKATLTNIHPTMYNDFQYPKEANTSIHQRYHAHVSSGRHHSQWTKHDEVEIDLLEVLNGTKAGLYDEVMKWAKRAAMSRYHFNGNRQNILKNLYKRFDANGSLPKKISIELTNGHNVEIVLHDFLEQLYSLLMDRFLMQQENLIFKGSTPMEPPEEDPQMIDDVDTGFAYRT